jgi:hypothetical protein
MLIKHCYDELLKQIRSDEFKLPNFILQAFKYVSIHELS